MSPEQVAALREEVIRRFGVPADTVRVIRAPYRICPLGAHIDHQLGPVLGMALGVGAALAYAATADGSVRLQSCDLPGEVRFQVNAISGPVAGDWGNFARGAAAAWQTRERLERGIVGLTHGPLKEGGLSSSAAIGVAYLLALGEANQINVPRTEFVDLDQWIENRYLGLRNGILDPASILLSRANHLTRIDCAARTYTWYAPPAARNPPAILIAFSGLTKALVGTDYNRRVAECDAAAEQLLIAAGRAVPQAKLGHVTPDEYAAHGRVLSGALARRAAHFFDEAARVTAGLRAWEAGDFAEFGRLMTASGESSIVNYECGAPPLVDLYQVLVTTPGVFGARFSGAGFRGCCIALVDPARAATVAEEVTQAYAARQPEWAAVARPTLITHSADGAEWLRG